MFTRYTKGMVFWADLPSSEQNPNVQAGKRPVIIVSNDACNMTSKTITVVPCTTNVDKPALPTHTIINLGREEDSLVLCEMILTISKSLLCGFMGILDRTSMDEIDKLLLVQLGIEEPKKIDNILIDNKKSNKEEPGNTQEQLLDEKRKKNQGKRVSSLKEMSAFIHYFEQNGFEKTMVEYGVPTKTAIYQRLGYYKRKIKRGVK